MRGHDVTMAVVRAYTKLNGSKPKWASQLASLWYADRVRLLACADDHFDMEDLKGDCFNPKVNPEIQANTLAMQEAEFEMRVARMGVYGLVGEVKADDGQWDHVDSCWGFVGEDYLGSGYDADIARATIEAIVKAGVA